MPLMHDAGERCLQTWVGYTLGLCTSSKTMMMYRHTAKIGPGLLDTWSSALRDLVYVAIVKTQLEAACIVEQAFFEVALEFVLLR